MAEDIKFRHTMPVQIRFSDVDQFGHMNNSVYFSLYDLAKTTYIKDVFGSADWSKLAIVVANINANFFMPVFFSDHLVIETAVVHLGHKSFTLLQRAVTTDTHEVKCECRTVIPAISTPTPNKAYPNDAITNGYPYSEPKTVTVAPSKLCDIPNHLMKTPISMMLVAIKPVKRTPILSRIIPPKISIRKNTLNQP